MARMVREHERGADRSEALRHMPQLDALRAFAVLAVLVHHFYPAAKLPWGLATLPWGLAGVHLFFVLSGFLITGILLNCRGLAREQTSPWFLLRRFYIRRFLRIFPLYYAVIAIAVLLNVDPARSILVWLATYTLNFHMAYAGYFVANFAHLWSLAVEEHFYLLWPWIILLAPRKWLMPSALVWIFLSPIFRVYAYQTLGGVAGYILTPGCLDMLSMGALLAMAYHSAQSRQRIDRWLTLLALPIGLAMTVFFQGWGSSVDWRISTALSDFGMGLLFCWLIASASRGFRGVPGAILESRLLLYVGKISYGIYVFHGFVPDLLRTVSQRLGWHVSEQGPVHLVLATAVTLILASLSWHFFEQPINGLKRHFPYNAKQRGTPVSSGAEAPAEIPGLEPGIRVAERA